MGPRGGGVEKERWLSTSAELTFDLIQGGSQRGRVNEKLKRPAVVAGGRVRKRSG